MPKIRYTRYNPPEKSRILISQANNILNEYAARGFRLTVRQLYYQFVTRGLLANIDRNYTRLSNLIARGREGGLIDWDAIVDRKRTLRELETWENAKAYLEEASERFHLDLWQDQRTRIEVWVEKDALIDIISRAALQYGVPYLSTTGYASASAVWNAAHDRILKSGHKYWVILHLSDHDPSGIHMSRDLRHRLEKFSTPYHGMKRPVIEVRRIALTMQQVEEVQPPPNPAKESDPRWPTYRAEFGDKSWELDALDPAFIINLITEEIEGIADMPLLQGRLSEEDEIRKKLRKVKP